MKGLYAILRPMILTLTALALSFLPAWGYGESMQPTLRLSCLHDPTDEILGIICDRVRRESTQIAGSLGYVVDAADRPADGSELATRSLDIRLTANRPDSPFASKRIHARLTGRTAGADHTPWEQELTAEGIARDLVHPVADALLERIEALLTAPSAH